MISLLDFRRQSFLENCEGDFQKILLFTKYCCFGNFPFNLEPFLCFLLFTSENREISIFHCKQILFLIVAYVWVREKHFLISTDFPFSHFHYLLLVCSTFCHIVLMKENFSLKISNFQTFRFSFFYWIK